MHVHHRYRFEPCSDLWPRGPMDKASAYGAGDCRFESCRGHCAFGWDMLVCVSSWHYLVHSCLCLACGLNFINQAWCTYSRMIILGKPHH